MSLDLIEVEFKRFRTVRDNLNNVRVWGGERGTEDALLKMMKHLESKVRDKIEKLSAYPNSPYRKTAFGGRTGASIAHSWEHVPPKKRGNLTRVILINRSPHAAAVEFGTHGPITSRSGKKLRFIDPRTGKWVSKWEVAGQKPKNYFMSTITEEKPRLLQFSKVEIKTKILQAIAKRTR